MQDARWLSISVDPSKMHLLAQKMCQSKGQSSAAILRPETQIVYMFFQGNSEELIAPSANLK